jgi:hypothetical protein
MNWGSLTYTTLTVVLSLVSGCRSPSSGSFQPATPVAPPAVSYQDERPAETFAAPKSSCGPGCRSCPGGSSPSWSVPELFAPVAG